MSSTGSTADDVSDLSHRADLPQRLAAALDAHRPSRGDGRRFAPELSYGRHFGPAPATARAAAVIALLFRRAGHWYIPLTQRPATLGRHGGQISLPGGTVEPGETSFEAAVRELTEELGVDEAVTAVGQLSDCYVYASDFLVTPWLATTPQEPAWQPHADEVERVVELPLDALVDPQRVGTTTIVRGPLVFRAPCYQIGGECVWGATAIILAELADLLRRRR